MSVVNFCVDKIKGHSNLQRQARQRYRNIDLMKLMQSCRLDQWRVGSLVLAGEKCEVG